MGCKEKEILPGDNGMGTTAWGNRQIDLANVEFDLDADNVA
ncbi:MAG: hypothetical protein ACK48X_04850 [Planctomycetota bacterium]|jgi:hypothetical protein